MGDAKVSARAKIRTVKTKGSEGWWAGNRISAHACGLAFTRRSTEKGVSNDRTTVRNMPTHWPQDAWYSCSNNASCSPGVREPVRRGPCVVHLAPLAAHVAEHSLGVLVSTNAPNRHWSQLTGKLVLHHHHKGRHTIGTRSEDLVNDQTLVLLVGGDERLLADVRRELVLGHEQNLAAQLRDDKHAVLWLALLEHKLHDVVLYNRRMISQMTHSEARIGRTPN